MPGSGGGPSRRGARGTAIPVPPGEHRAPADAGTGAGRAARSEVPPASVPPAIDRTPVLPVANPPPPPPPGGEGGAARDLQNVDSDDDERILPESINTSRWDGDNAKRQLAGQDGFEGFDKNGVSFDFIDICQRMCCCAFQNFKWLTCSCVQVNEIVIAYAASVHGMHYNDNSLTEQASPTSSSKRLHTMS